MNLKSNFYLIEYLENNFNDKKDVIDTLKYELDKKIYYYGENFKNHTEKKHKKIYIDFLKSSLKNIIFFLYKDSSFPPPNTIMSNSYFTVNDELSKIGFNVCQPPWSNSEFRKKLNMKKFFKNSLIKKTLQIQQIINNYNFIDILDDSFISEVEDLKAMLINLFKHSNFKAGIFPADLEFFQRLSIKLLKEVSKPSFTFIHGLSTTYDLECDNLSDYLIVWGDKLKSNYIKTGFNKDKILVSGHPYYQKFTHKNLKFDFDDILVGAKPICGAPIGYDFIIPDRGNSILYLYKIEKILKRLGVKKVRFRPHPVENPDWYFKFIDKNFFNLDKENLSDSLKRSSLVIGSSSTIFIESLYYGVNYVAFEPNANNIDLVNLPIVPPFDGSDKNIPVAKNEDELYEILKERVLVNPDCFHDYIKTPFDIKFIKDLI